MESVLADVRNYGLQVYNVGKRGQICIDFFEIFELLEQPFLSKHFLKFICSEVFSSVIGCIRAFVLKGTP